jgi:hypothetical protein
VASELGNLTTRNIAAIGLTGFCGAFGLYLLRELWRSHGGVAWAALNLMAAVILLALCASSWPALREPRTASASWHRFALAALACVLAVVARLPGLQA